MLVWGGLTASAQDARGVLRLGDVVVTGFSGVRPPAAPLPPHVDPIEKTFIDLDLPSARAIVLDALGGPPQGQVVQAAKPFAVTAAQVGQVFAIALDDATPPNIYLAATSAYGLPIVVPDRDGDGRPDRSRLGGPNANFMPGLFGPITANGGPGSIWKIDGRTGAVTLFANVTLDRIPNSGPALGGLAFDPNTKHLFVADRDTGMIHRFGLDGGDRGRFDHGADGLRAAGLPPVPFDPRKRLDITNPAFDSGNTATWAYAPVTRRVFGLAIHRGRLYYAVASGSRIWSVSLRSDGSFGPDARIEVAATGAQGGAEISSIAFDAGGQMLLAERAAPTGAYDYKALTAANSGRVLRFRPNQTGAGGTPFHWEPAGDYAIGFTPNYQNGDGGIALGYGYNPAGVANRGACGGTLWTTGSQLRVSPDAAMARRLQPGGPFPVDGLQSSAVSQLRPQNTPPLASYFIDFDDRAGVAGTPGHMGDVHIWQQCAAVAVASACPPGTFNVGGACLFALACPLGTVFAAGHCVYPGCPLSYVSIGGRCVPPPLNCKPNETYWDGRCEPPKCQPGLDPVDDGNVSRPRTVGETIGGYCKCPAGQEPGKDGSCGPPATDECTPVRQLRGECVPPTPPPTAGACEPPDFPLPDGTCCKAGVGVRPRPDGTCGPVPPPPAASFCPVPPAVMVDGTCCYGDRIVDACAPRLPSGLCAPGSDLGVTIVGPPTVNICCTYRGDPGNCSTRSVTAIGVPSACSPEAIAAGVCPTPPAPGGCGAGLFPSNDGKTCCTWQQITSETCGMPPPVKARSVKKKKKPEPKKKREPVPDVQPRATPPQGIPGFSIGIGIGGGGRSGGGGGRPGGGGGGGSRPR